MKAYIDGSSNGRYGYLITEPHEVKKIVQDHPMTNNQAEWMALIQLCMDLDPNSLINVYSDSQIVVNQFSDEWKTNDVDLLQMKRLCKDIIETKDLKVSLIWIPRNKNVFGKELERLLKQDQKERKRARKQLWRCY